MRRLWILIVVAVALTLAPAVFAIGSRFGLLDSGQGALPLPTLGRSRFGVREACGQAWKQQIEEAVEFGGAVVRG